MTGKQYEDETGPCDDYFAILPCFSVLYTVQSTEVGFLNSEELSL